MVEQELILYAQKGDRKAFSRIVEIYMRKLYRSAYFFVHNMEDASDIVQEVFMRFYKNIKSFNTERPVYPYLYRICKNLSCNYHKKYKNSNYASDETENLPSNYKSSDEIMEGRELKSLIEKCIEKLPEKFREIVILKHIDGLSYDEIAEILDIPKGTVMSRLYHGRQKLKALMEENNVEL